VITVGRSDEGVGPWLFREAGFDPAKLKAPSDTPKTTSTKAAKIRGLKNADLEEKIFFIVRVG
jgi:hypothetical protein